MDYFSLIPDDCMICIFKYLDRDSLDVVERINRMMHALSNLPEFHSVKRNFNDIAIFRYEDEAGKYNFAPPSAIIYYIQRFLRRNNTEVINFINVCIDRRFIDDCTRAIRYYRGEGCDLLKFQRSSLAYGISDSDKQYIMRRLMTLGVSAFIFDDCELDSLIDESIIAAFASIPVRCIRNLRVLRESEARKSAPLIRANKELFSSIVQFFKFVVHFVVLETDWIFELIQKVLHQAGIQREWEFSVTSRHLFASQGTIGSDTELVTINRKRYKLVHLPTGNSADIRFHGRVETIYKTAGGLKRRFHRFGWYKYGHSLLIPSSACNMLTRTTVLLFAVAALTFADHTVAERQLIVNTIAILRAAADKVEHTYGPELDGLVSNYEEKTHFTDNLGVLVGTQALRVASDDVGIKKDFKQAYFLFSELMSNDN